MPELSELLLQRESIEQQIAEIRQRTRADAVSQIRSIMIESGLTMDDLRSLIRLPGGDEASGKSRSSGGERRKVAPKFKNQETGAVWSGRGMKPRWISEALQQGKTLQDFAITA